MKYRQTRWEKMKLIRFLLSLALPLQALQCESAHELNRNCCQNGGTCFLGTFSICPKHFTGRHCEHDKRIGLCGTVRHGEWTKDGCLFCQCVQGVLHCFPHGLQDGCGPTKENLPDQMQAGARSEGLSLQHEAYLLTAPSLLTLLWRLL